MNWSLKKWFLRKEIAELEQRQQDLRDAWQYLETQQVIFCKAAAHHLASMKLLNMIFDESEEQRPTLQ